MKQKKILNLSITDIGGAGEAASSVHNILLDLGYESNLLVLTKKSRKKNIIRVGLLFIILRNLIRFFIKYLKRPYKTNPKYDFKDVNHFNTVLNYFPLKIIESFKPDLVFVYFISTFISVSDILKQSSKHNFKVVIWLVDLAPLTGGCHFTLSCNNYKTGCSNCPAIFNNLKISNINYLKKKSVYELLKPIFVYGTSDLKMFLDSSMAKNYETIFIPFPLNAHFYNNSAVTNVKQNRNELRMKLGISDEKIILLGSTNFADYRKGGTEIKESLINLEIVDPAKVIILTVGSTNFSSDFFKVINFGYVDYNKLMEAYAISDIFISASLDDIGPFMIAEAQIFQCVIISYNTGLAKDLILDKETGYMVKSNSPKELSTVLEFVLNQDPNVLNEVAKKGSEKAMEFYCKANIINKIFNFVNS